MSYQITYQAAVEGDEQVVLDFIKGIAEYEKMSDQVVNTPELLHEWMFEKKICSVVFAVLDGRKIGFALYFHNYSTFVGKAGIYLEDLFVWPKFRGMGAGKGLFTEVARIAASEGCERMEWCCLDWNRPSIDFYLSMGAVPMDEWTTYRLSGDALRRLGTEQGA